MVVLDLETGQVVLWNPAAEAIFGYSAAEAIGMRLELLVPEPARADFVANLEQYRAGGRGALGGPADPFEIPALRKGGEEIVVELLNRPMDEPPTDGRFLLVLARDLTENKRAEAQRAQLVQEQAARAEAEAAQQRLLFLAEASKQLGDSLNYQVTLRNVARLAIPTLADWCIVDLFDEGASLRQLAVAHADPAKEALIRELRQRFSPDASHPIQRAIRTGRSELAPRIEDGELVARARGPEHLRLLRALGIYAHIVVPLVARGRTLGAISFVRAGSGRGYDEADLALAEELGRRRAGGGQCPLVSPGAGRDRRASARRRGPPGERA